MSPGPTVLLAVAAALLAGCDYFNPPPPPRPIPTAQEIEEIIRANVRREGELLIISDNSFRDIVVMPRAGWTIQCGSQGFRIHLAREVDDFARLTLTWRSLPAKACNELAPAAGRVMEKISAGQ